MKVLLKIILSLGVFMSLGVSANDTYIDQAMIDQYESYIESKVGKLIDDKTNTQKQALLGKIDNLIETYPESNVSEDKKKTVINLLYALELYLEKQLQDFSDAPQSIPQLTIRVIDDVRCTDCETDNTLSQLQSVDYLVDEEYEFLDFADKGVAEYLIENNIQYLPAFIFSSNDIVDNNQIVPYLTKLPDGNYSLNIGASFDPYEERSARGFQVVSLDTIAEILGNSYTLGDDEAELLWLEYSDLQCPYCAMLSNRSFVEEAQIEFPGQIQYSFQNFPLATIHPHAYDSAKILECTGKVEGSQEFFALKEKIFQEFEGTYLTTVAVEQMLQDEGYNYETIISCAGDDVTATKIDMQMQRGVDTFSVNATPTGIMINKITGEYEKIPGAVEYETLQSVIQRLLSE